MESTEQIGQREEVQIQVEVREEKIQRSLKRKLI